MCKECVIGNYLRRSAPTVLDSASNRPNRAVFTLTTVVLMM